MSDMTSSSLQAWSVQGMASPMPRASRGFAPRASHILRPSHSGLPHSLRILSGFAAFVGLAGAGTASATTSSIPSKPAANEAGSLSQTFGRDRRRRAGAPVPVMLSEIKRRAGLTGAHLAHIFNVSRRAVHLWASGEKLTLDNAAKVQSLLEEVVALEAATPTHARDELLRRYSWQDQRPQKPGAGMINRGAILEADQSPIGDEPRFVGRRARSGKSVA